LSHFLYLIFPHFLSLSPSLLLFFLILLLFFRYRSLSHFSLSLLSFPFSLSSYRTTSPQWQEHWITLHKSRARLKQLEHGILSLSLFHSHSLSPSLSHSLCKFCSNCT